MARKTVPVKTIIEKANYFFANSEDDKECARTSVANFVEVLLHNVDSYAGYNYLPSAGVNYADIQQGKPFKARDESRRVYYIHRKSR